MTSASPAGHGGGVRGGVQPQSEEAEPGHGPLPQAGRSLADAAGEHEHVQPAEGGRHRGDAGAQPVQPDIDGEPGRRVRPDQPERVRVHGDDLAQPATQQAGGLGIDTARRGDVDGLRTGRGQPQRPAQLAVGGIG